MSRLVKIRVRNYATSSPEGPIDVLLNDNERIVGADGAASSTVACVTLVTAEEKDESGLDRPPREG